MESIYLGRFLEVEKNFRTEHIVSITQDDYNELIENEKLIFNFLSISNLYQICKLNYNDLLQFKENFEKKLIYNNVLVLKDDSDMLNTNRYLLNFLFSFRTYIDHLETFIKRQYKKDSIEFIELKSLLKNIFDNNFEYRFFYKLRNYAQHCSLPINNFEIQPSLQNGEYSVEIIIGFNVKKLLNDFDWGAILKKDLKGLDMIDLFHTIDKFTNLIKEINQWFCKLISSPIDNIKSKIESLTEGKIKNTSDLCLIQYDENQKFYIVFSIFRYITLIDKNNTE